MQSTNQVGSFARRRIVDATIRLYREIGYRKTTVADIARGASMSPPIIYRFFSSKRAIEEAIIADLFDQAFATAFHAAQGGGSPLQRLEVALRAISALNENRRAQDGKLHELMAAATCENWPITLWYANRIRSLIREIIAAGQASGELRQGSPIALASCVVESMDAHLNPSRSDAGGGPTFKEMIGFCAGALLAPTASEALDNCPDLIRTVAG